jgi:hypothetical protein
MKRFHVHVHVADLEAGVAFYSRLFATAPTRHEVDYAKWMLDDPRINFAISSRGGAPGVDHLGIQVDSSEELEQLAATARDVAPAIRDEGATTCCYARSEKHWIVDPAGVAWEHFHTLADIPVFREPAAAAKACCPPAATGAASRGAIAGAPSATSGGCC